MLVILSDMTNRSKPRYLAPPHPFLSPVLLLYFPLSYLSILLSFPFSSPCCPGGFLGGSTTEYWTVAGMHQVFLSLGHSRVIGCEETGESGLGGASIICRGMAPGQEKTFACHLKGSQTFGVSDGIAVNIAACVSVTCGHVVEHVSVGEGGKKKTQTHTDCEQILAFSSALTCVYTTPLRCVPQPQRPDLLALRPRVRQRCVFQLRAD